MTQTYEYDVFISHSSKDKDVARDLAERLRKDGLRVWFDEWVVKPGDMIGLKIEQGLEQSRALVLLVSGNSFASDWVTLERHTVLFRDPTNAQRRFIPVRLDDAEIRDILRHFAYVDWREHSNEQYGRLLTACQEGKAAETPSERKVKMPWSKVLKAHGSGVLGVAVMPDSSHAVSASNDKTLRVWDLLTGKLVRSYSGHDQGVLAVAVSPDGLSAVSASHRNVSIKMRQNSLPVKPPFRPLPAC